MMDLSMAGPYPYERAMTDFAISVFALTNDRGYIAPKLNISYGERDSNAQWTITCGGNRVYLIRHATPLEADMEEQAADSHFMVDRLKVAFMFGGAGLFRSKCHGRLIFRNVQGDVTWDTQLDFPDPFFGSWPDETITTQVADWYGAICTQSVLRRAGNDAYLALMHPHEALLYAYRGMEWIVVGTKISWDDLAKDTGVSTADLREFKKMANVEGGARHPTQNLQKMRAELRSYSGWVTCLFDAINAARVRLDSSYTPKNPKQLAAVFARAVPAVPYE
jgi:hypothetical protein